MRRAPHLLLPILATASAIAQGTCEPDVYPAGPRNGAGGDVEALHRWDPDGPGPLSEVLVVAGDFDEVFDRRASVAAYDEVTGAWTALARCFGEVLHVGEDANGDLLIGGEFTLVDGNPITGLARYVGGSWQPIGGSVQLQGLGRARIDDTIVLPNGDLVVGGYFTSIGGVPAVGLARWDGAAWSAFGDPIFPWQIGQVSRLALLPNGDLVAAGTFQSIGGVAVNGIAVWDGTTWAPLGPVTTGLTFVTSLAQAANGDLFAVGVVSTSTPGGAEFVARWDGATWSTVPGLTGFPTMLHVTSNGALLAGGEQLEAGGVATKLASWDGATWSAVPGAAFDARPRAAAELGNGDLVVGGAFRNITAPPVAVGGLARFDGQTWSALASGTEGRVHDVALPIGDAAIAVGDFTQLGGAPAGGVAEFIALGWTGQGLQAPSGDVLRIVERLDGSFALATRPVSFQPNLHYWFGGVGSMPVGRTTGTPELLVLPDGDLLVGSSGPIVASQANRSPAPLARLDVATGLWSALDLAFTGTVTALAVLADGSVVVGGEELASNGAPLGDLVRWDGQAWDTMSATPDGTPRAIAALPGGGFVVVGAFDVIGGVSTNGIARYDGAAWHPYGAGVATSFGDEGPLTVSALPAGQLLVGGEFAAVDGVPAQNLARWDGQAWHAVGNGTDGAVRRITVDGYGRIALCGDFLTVDDQVSARLAILAPSCFPNAMSYGAGCALVGQGLHLSVEQLPLRGGTLRTVATGLPQTSIALGVLSTQQTVVQLAPLGLPAAPFCSLLVQPTVVQVLAPDAGRASFAFDVPNSPSVTGLFLHNQVLSFELDASGTLTSVAVSQGVSMVIGSLW